MDNRPLCMNTQYTEFTRVVGVLTQTGYPVRMAAKTQRERDKDAREAKLERIKDQVDNGDLVIRKMTDAEAKKWAKRRTERERSLSPAEARRAAAAVRRRERKAARPA